MGIKITPEQIQPPRTQGWGVVNLKRGQRADGHDDHSHSYDEYVIMLKGRCILRNAGNNVEYRAGDIGFFPRNQKHNAVEALEDTSYLWTRGDAPLGRSA